MKRRDVLIGTVALAVWPRFALAQTKSHVVGILLPGNIDPTGRLEAFKEAMRDLGYVEGQNLQLELRSGDGDPAKLAGLARDLANQKVDVIVAWLTPSVRAARLATAEIPIVMASAGDPVATGLVASLSHPGGNITGMAAVTPELAGKNIELIRELLPGSKSLAALCNETDAFTKVFLEQVRVAAEKQQFELDTVMTNPAALDAAFQRIHHDDAEAVIVQPSLPTERCARLALKAHVPAVCPIETFASIGGLLAYAGRSSDQFRTAADYVDKILKGTKPSDLPIQLPTRFDLHINLKTARALGLTISPAMIARASDVIE
jgi:putative ABC transport system substrate-binding protein